MAGTQGRFWMRETAGGFEICGRATGGQGWVTVAVIGDKDGDAAADARLLTAAPFMRDVLSGLLADGVLTREEDRNSVSRAIQVADEGE